MARSRLIATLAAMAAWALPAAAWATPADDFAAAPITPIFQLQTGVTPDYLSQAGEFITDQGPGYCGAYGAPANFGWPYAQRTAWYAVKGNGRTLRAWVRPTGIGMMIAVYASQAAAFPPANPADPNYLDNPPYLDCGFDPQLGHDDAWAQWQSVAGATYWVQVGECWQAVDGTDPPCHAPNSDRSFISWVASAPPSNDARAGARTLGASASADNNGATLEAGERSSCNGVVYDKTVWFRHTATDGGQLRVAIGGLSGVVTIVRASDGVVVGCGSGAATARVARGAGYLVQVGGVGVLSAAAEGAFTVSAGIADPDHDADGFLRSGDHDCRDDLFAVNPRRPEIKNNGLDDNCDGYVLVDADDDGSPAERDCADGDPRRKAAADGGVEIRGNKVDEDCDHVAQPFRSIRTAAKLSFLGGRLTLTLTKVPRRAKLKIRCSLCTRPTVKRSYRRARKRVVLSSAVLGTWHRGSVADLDVTARRRVGHRWTWKVTDLPRSVDDCKLEPGVRPRC